MHPVSKISCLTAAVAAFTSTAFAADIRVGSAQPYKTLAAGVAAANAGDRILLDAGTYTDDTATVTKPLTIEGVGAGAVLKITRAISNHKGILVTQGAVTVRNVTFEGAFVTDADGKNGAGIRMESGDLTVENCTFRNNQDGMLVNPNPSANLTIVNSTFSGNGSGDGYTHGIYVNEIAQVTVRDSRFDGTKVGHDIKSRALRTTVVNTVLDDGVSGTPSYAIDLPNGGIVTLDGLRITQGTQTNNPAMIAYGAEGNLKAANSLLVTNSTFVNQISSPSAAGVNNFTTVAATLMGNTWQGTGNLLRGAGTVTSPVYGAAVRQGSVLSSLQMGQQSSLRFTNTSGASGSVRVTLTDPTTGANFATWQSGLIPPDAAVQVPITAVEGAATAAFTKPATYVASVQASFTGLLQHIVTRSDGALSNLSLCDNGPGANGGRLPYVHSSLLSAFPSRVAIFNSATAATRVTLGLYDAQTGTKLGTYTTANIIAGGQVEVTAAMLEAGANVKPASGQYYYTLKVESPFTGTLQHLVQNQAVGLTADMTNVCALKGS